MSKAFELVSRNKLFEYLEEILTPCELHIIHFRIHDNVAIKVQQGKTAVGIY